MKEWMNWDEAVETIANAMFRFDQYVENEQGSCDAGTFESMMAAARARYEELVEEAF